MVSSVGPSSEGIEELWVVLAYKEKDGVTLLVGIIDVKGDYQRNRVKTVNINKLVK